MERKRCSRCGETRPLSDFTREKRPPDGYGYWCKSCRSEYQLLSYADRKRGYSLDEAFEPKF